MTSIAWLEWTDALAAVGWTEEPAPPTNNVSVGFIVHEDDDYIELACTYAPDTGQWNATMSVPKNMIVKRDTLNLGWGPNAS